MKRYFIIILESGELTQFRRRSCVGHRIFGQSIRCFMPPERGAGITIIAVLDSGVNAEWLDHSGIDYEYCDFVQPQNRSPKHDQCGHGTHVLSIIHAIAPLGAKFVICRILDYDGYGYFSDISLALNYVTNQFPQSKLINMSMSWKEDATARPRVSIPREFGVLCDRARAVPRGFAGNEPGPVSYPAAFSSVIAVGALGKSCDRRASFSGLSPTLNKPEFYAAGDCVRAVDGRRKYLRCSKSVQFQEMTGTSMSAPHVTEPLL
eukprot:GILK01011769.1.p1 GENE.GILK01011769.1~~GILK01011769.1.p1  ORF type:complete len:263 (-),score=-12.66 GILK01011769.1:333-1121(-)